MTPTFTVLIGSAGRKSLKASLDSIARQQREAGDQVIVSFDTFERGHMEEQQEFVRSYGEGFIATSYNAGYHWLGVEQINHALRTVPITGSHLFTIGDDDVFVDGAYHHLRRLCISYPDRPILFRFQAPNRAVLWDKPRMRPCLISGCCIAAPVQFNDLMHTRIETTHDYDWMMEIIRKAHEAGHEPVWVDYVGVIARPDVRGDDVAHAGVWQCWACKRWKYREDLVLDQVRCACGVPIDLNSLLPRTVDAVPDQD